MCRIVRNLGIISVMVINPIILHFVVVGPVSMKMISKLNYSSSVSSVVMLSFVELCSMSFVVVLITNVFPMMSGVVVLFVSASVNPVAVSFLDFCS